MSADQMNGSTPVGTDSPQMPPVMQDGDLLGTLSSILHATDTLARQAASSATGSPAEAQKLMAAVLAGAQAFSVLHPARLQGGDTPEARVAATPAPPSGTRDQDRDGKIGES